MRDSSKGINNSKVTLREALKLDRIAIDRDIDRFQHLIDLALRTLSVTERKVIYLRFWQRFTIAEIADRLNVSWEDADFMVDESVRKIGNRITRNKGKRKEAI